MHVVDGEADEVVDVEDTVELWLLELLLQFIHFRELDLFLYKGMKRRICLSQLNLFSLRLLKWKRLKNKARHMKIVTKKKLKIIGKMTWTFKLLLLFSVASSLVALSFSIELITLR